MNTVETSTPCVTPSEIAQFWQNLARTEELLNLRAARYGITLIRAGGETPRTEKERPVVSVAGQF